MCREIMDIRAKRIKSDCLRRIVSPDSRLGWRLLRVSVEQDEARKHWRSSVVKATTRKYLHQEKKRAQLAKVSRTAKDTDKNQILPSVCEEGNPAALLQRPPPGAMAPENTTQYLMGNVYEDLLQKRTNVQSYATVSHQREGSVSPQNIDNVLDCSYDACLAFQQRDFEEHFGMLW